MKTLLFLSLLVGLQLVANAKKSSTVDNYVEIKPNLFVSKYETTNIEYNAFLNDIRNTCTKEAYELYKPDSSLWVKASLTRSTDPWIESYSNHPGFGKYPVVNISKEGIDKYCQWKTDEYNSNTNRAYKKVVFRLPSEIEWMSFTSPNIGQRLPWDGDYPYLIQSKGSIVPLANVKLKDYTTGHYEYVFDGALTTNYVGKYKSNQLGLFDMIGNVAELTNDNKIKGGSWDNTIEESYIDLSQSFEAPDPRVGFRLVMEIIEK